MSKISYVVELGEFLWKRKKWWLIPIMIALLLLGGLIVATGSSTIAPFIYALF